MTVRPPSLLFSASAVLVEVWLQDFVRQTATSMEEGIEVTLPPRR
jgi:hypothetical protein